MGISSVSRGGKLLINKTSVLIHCKEAEGNVFTSFSKFHQEISPDKKQEEINDISKKGKQLYSAQDWKAAFLFFSVI